MACGGGPGICWSRGALSVSWFCAGGPGAQLHALPYAGKMSRPFWCSELVYALTRLSVSLEDGLLTPSFLMPPSNSGENKWAIHAKREEKGERGGGDATDKLR